MTNAVEALYSNRSEPEISCHRKLSRFVFNPVWHYDLKSRCFTGFTFIRTKPTFLAKQPLERILPMRRNLYAMRSLTVFGLALCLVFSNVAAFAQGFQQAEAPAKPPINP